MNRLLPIILGLETPGYDGGRSREEPDYMQGNCNCNVVVCNFWGFHCFSYNELQEEGRVCLGPFQRLSCQPIYIIWQFAAMWGCTPISTIQQLSSTVLMLGTCLLRCFFSFWHKGLTLFVTYPPPHPITMLFQTVFQTLAFGAPLLPAFVLG